jgi:glutaredoxin 3
MFTGPGCTDCAQTRVLLETKGLSYVEYDVSEPEHLAEYGRRLPRERSVPQVFIDGTHIGSFEDLQLLADAGDLDRYA